MTPKEVLDALAVLEAYLKPPTPAPVVSVTPVAPPYLEPIRLVVVDLSHFDNVTSYAKIKESGVQGVIYKATEGISYQDHTYVVQRQLALEVGLLWGSYHFLNNSDVDQQINNFVSYSQTGADNLFCIDCENIGSSTPTLEQAAAWISGVELALKRPGECVIYSGDWIKEKLGDNNDMFFGSRRLWLAHYSTTPVWPTAWEKPWLWQYTADGVGPLPHIVPGVTNHIDGSSFHGTGKLSNEWASGKA